MRQYCAGLILSAPFLARVALGFGPAEYFALIVLALTLLSYMSGDVPVRSAMMIAAGLLLGTIGTDVSTGALRYTFGVNELADGIGIIQVVMGLFGISEVLLNLEDLTGTSVVSGKIAGLLPTVKDWAESAWAIVRGTVVGFFVGLLPGGNPIIASLVSYSVEKRVAKHPERFGKGAIEGVAGPESANNSAAAAAFIPLLTIGIPSTPVMAILLGAFMIHGIVPGPTLIQTAPDVFWGVVASMYVGNVLLLVLNLPLIGIWVRILRVQYVYLFPLIFVFCLIGVFSLNNSVFELGIMIAFGVIGYLMKKVGYEPAPLIFGLILGPLLEEEFRRALDLYSGSLLVFFQRPLSAVFLGIAILLVLTPLWRRRSQS